MNAKLVILQGESAGSEFHLFKDRTVIGRAEQSDIVIIDPGSSRQHLEIVRSSTCYILTDLNSGNGTQLNGYKILKAELVNGDQIRVGSHEMRFVQHAGSTLDPHQRKIENDDDYKFLKLSFTILNYKKVLLFLLRNIIKFLQR